MPTACGPHPVNIAGGPTNVHPYVSAVGPTQFRKPLREPGQLGLCLKIVFAVRHQHADPPHSLALLRPRRERPRRCRAAEQRDELAPLHSITSSARSSEGRTFIHCAPRFKDCHDTRKQGSGDHGVAFAR